MTRLAGRTAASLFRRTAAALLVAVSLVATVPLAAAPAAKKSYDIPAGNATATLKQFAAQSGEQVLYSTDAVEGVKTNAVSGSLTAREALDAMVAGTTLAVTQDKDTGALAVGRAASPNAPRAAQKDSVRPEQGKVEDGKIVLDTYEVTGSRIRLNSGERPAQPVLTFTNQDMERLGVSDLGQLFQYIPSVTSSTAGLGSELANGSTLGGAVAQITARTTANLRGGTETATLLLVDGKRVPITARRNAGGNGYDLGGIPLSAVDRVEVLLDGASSIYGADAIYGVINVILKKRYAGTEVKLSYDNTFDGDAGIRTASLTHGFSTGKLSGLVTLSASTNNIMLLTDRRLTATYNRTLFGGTADGSTPTLFIQGAGAVNVAAGNLPGITPVTPRASIPNDANGVSSTVADFAAAAAPIGGNVPDRQGYTSQVRQKSGYARFNYDFRDWLQITAMARLGANRMSDNGQYRRMENVTIPAGLPGNPFGGAVRLSKIFYDLPLVYNVTETRHNEFSLTASGKLPGDWRYEAAINYVRGENNMIPTRGADGSILGNSIAAATVSARITAAVAAGRSPKLIYDSRTQSPNSPDALDEFFVNTAPTVLRDLNENWTYSAQADGRLLTLPAGDIRVLLGAERREEYLAFPNAIGGAVWGTIPQRDVNSIFAEAKVPVFSPKQNLPLLHQFDLNFAGRKESYSDVGGATTPRYGVAWRPIKSVRLRGSYGEGFLVPPLYRTAAVLTQSTLPWSALASSGADPLRGNTVNPGNVVVTSGGNPDLRPQKSEHLTYGVIVDVPRVKGLSVSLDWFDNKYTDNIGGIGTIGDRVLYAPDTITRGPNLPTDLTGWAGPIIAYDARVINISSARTAGYNFGVRWNMTTTWGDLTFASSGEKILRDEQRVLPTTPLTATINKIYRSMRVTSSLFWSHQGWDAGVTGVYGGKYWVDTSNATLAPSRYTDSVIRWDFGAGYDFGRRDRFGAKGDAWWRRALRDTKWHVTIIDAFNTEPPLDVRGFFSSSVIDMRLRRYVLDCTKRF
jgi:outer membrane receptor for ferrienterochelin and colicin